MDIDDLAIFVHAADAGSLSAAARRLGLTPTAASRGLQTLETALGVRLLHRNTRSTGLTTEGERFLPHARAVLAATDEGRASLRNDGGAYGLLRVTAPANFGRRMVAPVIPSLLAANPGLRIELNLSDTLTDLIGEGFDVAIRVARLRDSTLVAQRLAGNPIALCAAPAYLARAGRPRALADLAQHDCLTMRGNVCWQFNVAGKQRETRVHARFDSNSLDALREACIGGAGIARLSAWDIATELADGRLVRLDLDDASIDDADVWAVYPAGPVPPKVRLLVDAVRQGLDAILKPRARAASPRRSP